MPTGPAAAVLCAAITAHVERDVPLSGLVVSGRDKSLFNQLSMARVAGRQPLAGQRPRRVRLWSAVAGLGFLVALFLLQQSPVQVR